MNRLTNDMKPNYILAIVCIGLMTIADARAQQCLTLSQTRCREMALAHSEELQQADNKLRQAALDRGIADNAFLPKLDGSLTGACILPDMDITGMELRLRGTYMAGIMLTQPLYTGGRLLTGKRLARIGEEVAGIRRNLMGMDVMVEADKAYWTYIAVGRKVRMLEHYIVQIDTLYEQTRASLACGMTTENDLLRIEARRSDIRYQWQKAANGRELCRLSLCRILGLESTAEVVPTDTVLAVPQPMALASDIGRRPELQLLERQVKANRQQVQMARAEMLPAIGLSAGYTYYGNIKLHGTTTSGDGTVQPFTQEYRDGMGLLMLSVKIPFFSWGERLKKVRKARYDVQNAELDLQKNRKSMDMEVEQAIRNLRDAYLLTQTAMKGMEQANENLRVMRHRHAAAMASLTDLLDAQSQWQQAESNLIEAQTQYKIYETEYLRATGALEV